MSEETPTEETVEEIIINFQNAINFLNALERSRRIHE